MPLDRKPRVAWYIPSLLHGSGGILNMFQKADALAHAGFDCHLYVEGGDSTSLRDVIERYYGHFQLSYFPGFDLQHSYDLIVTTMFYSNFIAHQSGQKCPIVYFNQDYEALFHDMGFGYLVGENSYMHRGVPVTSGRWLTHRVGTEFGIAGYPVEIGADSALYRPLEGQQRENAICFTYQPEKFRRCPQLGIRALEIVKQRRPDATIYTYGSAAELEIDFEHINLGMLPGPREINELYNRCRAGLCVSSTNPSRVPFEMIAAGLPMVDVYRYNNLLDVPEDAILLAYQSSESMAEALITLLDDDVAWDQASKAGVLVIQRRSLAREHACFVGAVSRVFEGRLPHFVDQPLSYKRDPVVSLGEGHLASIKHFCQRQRDMATRRLLHGEGRSDQSTARGRSVRDVARADAPVAVFNVSRWEDVSKIGYKTLAAMDLYDYEVRNGMFRKSALPLLKVYARGSAAPPDAAQSPGSGGVVESLAPKALRQAEIIATPVEWSGLDVASESLHLHPNGIVPSQALLRGVVPAGTLSVIATIALANSASPAVEFSLCVVPDDLGRGGPRSDGIQSSPFRRLEGGEIYDLHVRLAWAPTERSSLRLLTRHRPDCPQVEYSWARWSDVRFEVDPKIGASERIIKIMGKAITEQVVPLTVEHTDVEVIEPVSLDRLSRARVQADPPEWSGFDEKGRSLSLHPNGDIPSIAVLDGAIPGRAVELRADIALPNVDSPPVQFALAVLSEVDGLGFADLRERVRDAPFVELRAGQRANMRLAVAASPDDRSTVILLTRHRPHQQEREQSWASWSNLRYVTKAE